MYNILIVDDEKNERDGIETLLRKGSFGLNVLKAGNGEEALSVLSKQSVDILLTDIKMPFMDGISLIRKIEYRKELFLILYSAYADFEYAQNAISLGVSKYLLKPINVGDFNQVITEAITWCNEKELQRSEAVQLQKIIEYSKFYTLEKQLQLLLTSTATSDKAVHTIRELVPAFESTPFIPLLVTCEAGEFIEVIEAIGNHDTQPFEFVYGLMDANTFLIILFTRANTQHVSAFCDLLLLTIRQKFQSVVFVIAGRELHKLSGLKAEYDHMSKYTDYYYFISSSTVVYVQKDNHIQSSYDVTQISTDKITTCIKAGNYSEAYSELQRLQSQIHNNRSYSPMFIKYVLTEMIKKISKNTTLQLKPTDLVNEIYATDNLNQTMDVIVNILKRIEQKEYTNHDQNWLIRSVKDLISRDYNSNEMGLAYLAGQVQVTSAYLSTLFKKETGHNISKFIAEYRIEQAKHLLKTTHLKIAEIGEQVGFQTPSYFISIFRSRENVSPAQYREREGI
ncbi:MULTISPECIES: response regulator [Paenibacillus]|uniref:response regulator n=1 Tax=Paenibacillus TaxID=44249 RepID=UPI00096F424F|nr:response regulator [Paenibacillus odorifer]OME44174.1 hypothetical protein BSK58_04620 [Paenibacillus odorifer]OZQ77398.1 hypothetical protein CA596_07455 [Paenibacillus odorifer]